MRKIVLFLYFLALPAIAQRNGSYPGNTTATSGGDFLAYVRSYGTNAYGVSPVFGNDTTPTAGRIYASLGIALTNSPNNTIFVIGAGRNPLTAQNGAYVPTLGMSNTVVGLPGMVSVVCGVGIGSYLNISNNCTVQNLVFTNVALETDGGSDPTSLFVSNCDFENLIFQNIHWNDVASPGLWYNCTFKNINAIVDGDCFYWMEDCVIQDCNLQQLGSVGAIANGTITGWGNHIINTTIISSNLLISGYPGYDICASNIYVGALGPTWPGGIGNQIDNCTLIGFSTGAGGAPFHGATDDNDDNYFNTGTGYTFNTNLDTLSFSAVTTNAAYLPKYGNLIQGFIGPGIPTNATEPLPFPTPGESLAYDIGGTNYWISNTKTNHIP